MNDELKLKEFVAPEAIMVGKHALRPFTATSLILLQEIGSPLLDQAKMAAGVPDIFFQIAAFIYLHAGDPKDVRRAVKDKEGFRDAVLDFTSDMDMVALAKAATSVQEILQRAVVGMDYQPEAGGPSPN
jgi:hypothetical protein